jgi:hypothetical protein
LTVEKFFELTDLPGDVCAACAADYVIQHESGACAIFCKHSRKGYMKLILSSPWKYCPNVADVPHLARAIEIAVALNKAKALGEAQGKPVQ